MLLRYGVSSFFLITCSAQNLSVGFAGGGGLTNAFDAINAGVPDSTTSYSQANDYVVGLLLEYRLSGSLSVEGDVLYRELHLTVAFVEPNRVLNSVSPSPVVSWELPLMAKYRLPWKKVQPFVEAGPAFRPTTNLNANPSHYGVSAGVGVATRWKQFEIAPMVRYTRWIRDRPLENLAESKSDQLELLVGVSSRPHSTWHPLSRRVALGLVGGTTLFHDVPTSSSAFIAQVPAASGEVYEEFGTTYASGSRVPLLGPALEAPLWKRFFLEVDGVHHPIDCTRRSVLSNGEVVDSFSGREGLTWEFPVLGKYKFEAGRVEPFVEAGPSFRLLTENSSLFGISGGAGVEVRLKSLKIAPALRFTHWGPQGYHSPSTEIILNQVEFLTDFLL
jgi:Outer membrane protein beta-barrel domain